MRIGFHVLINTLHILERNTSSESETLECGRIFSELLCPGDTVALFGDVGSGKTVFVKGICKGIETEEPVNSPTFIILNEYTGQLMGHRIKIRHFDFYRIEKQSDINELGIDEYLNAPDSITLIEWSEHILNHLREKYWKVQIQNEGENKRKIHIELLQ